MAKKNISIWDTTKASLDSLKLCKEESYSAVIDRLVSFFKENNSSRSTKVRKLIEQGKEHSEE